MATNRDYFICFNCANILYVCSVLNLRASTAANQEEETAKENLCWTRKKGLCVSPRSATRSARINSIRFRSQNKKRSEARHQRVGWPDSDKTGKKMILCFRRAAVTRNNCLFMTGIAEFAHNRGHLMVIS